MRLEKELLIDSFAIQRISNAPYTIKAVSALNGYDDESKLTVNDAFLNKFQLPNPMDIEKKLRIIKRLDRLDGFPDNTITALFLNKDQLWLGTKKGGFILVSLKSGSIFKERSWSRLPSNAINYFKSTAPNMIMFSQGNKLFIAGNDPESVLTLQSYFNWPLSISSSAVYKNKLVICGNGGLFIYSGFKSALKNYVKILKGGI